MTLLQLGYALTGAGAIGFLIFSIGIIISFMENIKATRVYYFTMAGILMLCGIMFSFGVALQM